MEGKRVFYSEGAYLLGLVILAFGAAFMEKADFGMSMVVAPAYLLHLKVSTFFPAFSFGMAEYCLQAVLIIALSAVLRRFRLKYLFSFVTAVVYGCLLDGAMWLAAFLPCNGAVMRVIFYCMGVIFGSAGVSLLFHTYIAPEAYELFVKEISDKFGKNINAVKTVYDCCSALVAVALSFAFYGFGRFEGVGIGTVVCAAVNGAIIGLFSRAMEKRFVFRDAWKLRRLFA